VERRVPASVVSGSKDERGHGPKTEPPQRKSSPIAAPTLSESRSREPVARDGARLQPECADEPIGIKHPHILPRACLVPRIAAGSDRRLSSDGSTDR
jgi:hypothetical protein